MRLIHLSDLHLGKRVNEFNMIEDQKYILDQILEIIDETMPEGIMIAGDVYDKSVASVEAVNLLSDFLMKLAERKLPVFIISGNHDSAERLAFASGLIDLSGIHISPAYDGHVEPFELEDRYGKVDIYMLPFIKPVHVRKAFEDEQIQTYTDAVRTAINHMNVNREHRNVLITHQFVTGALRSESEEISVGGSDNVDASVFADFDYVALGHMHAPQSITERIRYCGAPLKYSFSEANHNKSVTLVSLGAKQCAASEDTCGGPQDARCQISVKEIPLKAKHEMIELKGAYDNLMDKSTYEGTSWQTDYVHVTLTDENDINDAITRLQSVYRNIMKLDYDNKRTRSHQTVQADNNAADKKPQELFADLFEMQNAAPISSIQAELIDKLVREIWEDEI